MNLIGSIDHVNSVVDFGTTELAGARDVKTASFNGSTYVFVAGGGDNGIQVLSMSKSGVLTAQGSVDIPGVLSLEVLSVGQDLFLAASSSSDQIRMYRIRNDDMGSDGELTLLNTYKDVPVGIEPQAGAGGLDYPENMAQLTLQGTTFLFAAGYYSDSLISFRVNSDGSLTLADLETDGLNANYNLNGAYGIATHRIGNKAFVFVGGDVDNGISSFQVNNQGALNFVGSVSGAANAYKMVAQTFNGSDYLFVSDAARDRIQVYAVNANGALSFVSETPQYINGQYSNISGLEALEVDGVPFLLATAVTQDTMIILSLDASNQLQIVETRQDATELNGAFGMAVQKMGDRVFVLTAAQAGSRVTVVEVGGGPDPIVGTQDADRMVGNQGDDDLIGLGGADEIFGGAGFDVLSGRDGNDSLYGGADDDVLIGGDGNDFLAGGLGADVIVGGDGRDTVSYASSVQAVSVVLYKGQLGGGDAAGDSIREVENVEGSNQADTIEGDNNQNWILGLDGDDLLNGYAGRDRLDGGLGADTILGGRGRDVIYGGAAADSLDGEIDDDRIYGGAGADTLIGGAGNDTLNGGNGNDRLYGGAGNNVLFGGLNRDVFVFAPGMGDDRIEDFEVGLDRVDLSALPGFDSFADVQAAAFTIAGNTFLSLDGGASSITFLGVTEAQMTSDNFIL